jgi:tetratricopeptide (TPR) repeat protein
VTNGDLDAPTAAAASRPRQRVYVSSTYQDLQEFRRAVAETLQKAGYEVVAMETYTATDERPVDKCLADVRACDLYIGIVAWRYGFIPPGYDRSITELEYLEATQASKRPLMFLTDPKAPWPFDQVELEAKPQWERFRGELEKAHVVAYFKTPDDLARQVLEAVTARSRARLDEDMRILRDRQAQADRERSRERGPVVNFPPVDVSRFVDRVTERGFLRDCLGDTRLRMVKVIGRPGIGKSALASHVMGELEASLRASEQPSAEQLTDGLLYLSARTTGLSLERLQSDMIRLLDDAERTSLAEAWKTRATTAEKVATLLEVLCTGRYIVLLDAADVVVDDDYKIIEPGLRAFVECCLHRSGAPLLVLTSRVDLPVPPETLPAVRRVDLRQGLEPADAIVVLQQLDPQGELGLRDADPQLLGRAATITAGIPRALELLAGILQSDPCATLETLLADEEELGAQTVEYLVAEAYRRLDDDERRVMQALAVFRRPVAGTAPAFLLNPWFPGTDVPACLRRLVTGHFVTINRRTGEFALEAPDREHAYREIPETAGPPDLSTYRRSALELRAADFYAGIRKPPEQWLSLADVNPQLAEFEHCVQAGAFDRALEVLQPIDEQCLGLWGHFQRIIELRSSVLDKPVRPELRAANLAGLAASYQVVGDYDSAIRFYEQALTIAHEEGAADAEATYVGQLGRVYRHVGLMIEAVESFRRALEYYKAKGDRRGVGIWTDRTAYGTWYLGRLEEAMELEALAIAIASEVGDRRTEAAALSNLGVIYQTDGQSDPALAQQQKALDLTRKVGDRRGETIVVGRLGALAFDSRDYDAAIAHHTEALTIAEAINDRRERSNQLIGLGRALAVKQDFTGAVERLEAARSLEVPETSYFAALALGIVLFRRSDTGANAMFADALRRCRERLARCDRLYAARYAVGTALAGLAACTSAETSGDGGDLRLQATTEFEAALANCSGHGVVAATLSDLEELRAAGAAGIDVCAEPLERAVAADGA